MRGDEERQETVFVFDSLEDRMPAGHPLRLVRRLIDTALANLDPVFAELYADGGRPSIPPECLLRASLLQKLYALKTESVFRAKGRSLWASFKISMSRTSSPTFCLSFLICSSFRASSSLGRVRRAFSAAERYRSFHSPISATVKPWTRAVS
jgi:hypothetical protein